METGTSTLKSSKANQPSWKRILSIVFFFVFLFFYWQAFTGPLSPDFLRLQTPQDIQEAVDRQTAFAFAQQHQMIQPGLNQNLLGRLSITVAQARLVKNYGLTRMDPYVRIRVGHFIYETQTDPNGSKNPRFNRVLHTQLPNGVKSIYVEIYDERSFTMDELIAWAEIRIPDAVLGGETVESWYPLTGKSGDGMEGQINLVMSFSTQPVYPYSSAAPPVVVVPNVSGMPAAVAVTHQVPPQVQPIPQQPVVLSEADIQQIAEMFPNVDKEVIKSVGEANRGSREATINSLLAMTNWSRQCRQNRKKITCNAFSINQSFFIMLFKCQLDPLLYRCSVLFLFM